MIDKLPVSAIVVGYNEARLLEQALKPLSFCDEILYFDLGSEDDSKEVALRFSAKVIDHPRVDSCEWIHAKYSTSTKHEWVLITDPDEILSEELVNEIHHIFSGGVPLNNVGAISSPWIFYFKGKRLYGTNWGGINRRILLVNHNRFEFRELIHLGRKVKEGYITYDIAFKGNNFIHHYWMIGFRKLFEKHSRYLRNEGEARFKNGIRSTPREIALQPFRSFRNSFISARGYKDGFTGFFLSCFWAWYETSAKIQNYTYQKRAGN